MSFRWQEKVRRLQTVHSGKSNMVSHLAVIVLLFTAIYNRTFFGITAVRLSQNVQNLSWIYCFVVMIPNDS